MHKTQLLLICRHKYITHLNVRQFGQVLDVVLPEVQLLQLFALLKVGQGADLVDTGVEEEEEGYIHGRRTRNKIH